MKTLTKVLAVLSLVSFMAFGCKPKTDDGMSQGTEVEQDSVTAVPADSVEHQGDSSAVH